MIEEILKREEGKTLEFKENATSLDGIVKTVAAFANTAGGTIVVGIEDTTKKVVGLENPLQDETRIVDKIAQSISPFIMPNIEIRTYRRKTVIVINVFYSPGPYYVVKGSQQVVYVRFGSTSRVADDAAIATMVSLAKNITFDESPCPRASAHDIDWDAIDKTFEPFKKSLTPTKAQGIGILRPENGAQPSNGGMLLFGKNRANFFPDAIIRCVKFAGIHPVKSKDHTIVDRHLPEAIDEVLDFIAKNTFIETTIGRKRRVEVPQYPPAAVREAVINAIVHADYSVTGSSIIVSIFDDRLEITNPGAVPYGLSLESALSGASRTRNRVLAKTFHILELVEQWGSGLKRIIQTCIESDIKPPKFQELDGCFRVTFYSGKRAKKRALTGWERTFIDELTSRTELRAHDAARIWNVTTRTAIRRLKKLVDEGFIVKIELSPNDPQGKYKVTK